LGKASSRSLALATGSGLIHINQSLTVDVPAQLGNRARIKLVVVDSLAERDIGYIVFPVDKVASSFYPVQGWYSLTQDGEIPDGDGTTDFCIKCQISVEDQKSYQTKNCILAGPVYRPSRLTTSTENDIQTRAFDSSGQAEVYGIGVGLKQLSGIWFVDYLVPGGSAACSCCVQAFDRLCTVESAIPDPFSPRRLIVSSDTTAEELSNAVAGPKHSFVKLKFARDETTFSVILMRGPSQDRPDTISSSPPKEVRIRKGTGKTPSSSGNASVGCMSFMKSKPKKVKRAPKGFRPGGQTLQVGHQVVVLRDTHTHEGKACHAGEVMILEREGTHGWTYVRDGKGAFCWLPSDALQAAGAGEADCGRMQTVLAPSSNEKTSRHSNSTGKRRSGGQFSPIRKHHVSPAIPPALTPLPRGQHVLWDDEAVEADHAEPAHRPDQLLSANHSQVTASSAVRHLSKSSPDAVCPFYRLQMIPWILGGMPESTPERKTGSAGTSIFNSRTVHGDRALPLRELSSPTTALLAPRYVKLLRGKCGRKLDRIFFAIPMVNAGWHHHHSTPSNVILLTLCNV